ncbi:LacI family DNA-binding transcriptional regulator [Dactylosporangium darangshiense]|uniref:LacI family DNA-binding transcriptional regulator n=1 Tax=Dactylosporangium darangshiense TaxID=579108 RepID=UPI003624AFC7
MESPVAAKRVTLAQVAELAGVSVMTASYTYNRPGRVSDDARSKVLAAAAELGYSDPTRAPGRCAAAPPARSASCSAST